MDEASKLQTARRWLTAFTDAMKAEAVPDDTRRRIVNRVLFGNPDGDECAKLPEATFERHRADATAALGRLYTARKDPERGWGMREGHWPDDEETDRG